MTSARAALVEYSTTSLGGDLWRYDYSLKNVDPDVAFDEFSVYFDSLGVSGLTVAATPAGWDGLVVQPDPQLPDGGYFDALSLSGLVTPGASISGFSVTFTYLGAAAPGAQRFDLIVSDPFQTVYSGVTSAAPSAVPIPGSLALLAFGSCASALGLRRKKNIELKTRGVA